MTRHPRQPQRRWCALTITLKPSLWPKVSCKQLGGQTLNITSGADTRIVGSNVLGDQGLDINAGGNLNIEAAQNTQGGSSFNETKKSGLFSSGGLSFTIGKQQQSTDAQNQQTTAAASTVGAIEGNVNLRAGQTYTQRGSDVVAPGGDVNISAQTVTVAGYGVGQLPIPGAPFLGAAAQELLTLYFSTPKPPPPITETGTNGGQ